MIEGAVSGGTLMLTASGDLDLAERALFPELLALAAGPGVERVLVDLCAVDFVDSAGAAFLTDVAVQVGRAGGCAELRGAGEHVRYVLGVCGALGGYDVDAEHRCPPVTAPGPWRVPRD